MSDEQALSFKISGSIVGINSNPATLTLQACNTFTDENDCSWAIASTEEKDSTSEVKKGRLFKLKKGRLDFPIKVPLDDLTRCIFQSAISSHKKVWLTFKANNSNPPQYVIESIQLKDL